MTEQEQRKELEGSLEKSLSKSLEDSSPKEIIQVLIPHLFEHQFINVASQFLMEQLGNNPTIDLIKGLSEYLERFILKLNAFD